MKFVPFRLLRVCPYCNSTEVRRSQRKGPFETVVLRLLVMRPYRCERCTRRHYNFTFSRRHPRGAAPSGD